MATKRKKKIHTIRISLTQEIEEMLEKLKKEFKGLDYPELFKLALSLLYRRVEEKKRRARRKPVMHTQEKPKTPSKSLRPRNKRHIA